MASDSFGAGGGGVAAALSLSGAHQLVQVDCRCIASSAIAVRKWGEAAPEDGNGGGAASGAGDRSQRVVWMDGVVVPPPGFDQRFGLSCKQQFLNWPRPLEVMVAMLTPPKSTHVPGMTKRSVGKGPARLGIELHDKKWDPHE